MEVTGVLFTCTSVFSEVNDEVVAPQSIEAEAIFVIVGEEAIMFWPIFTLMFLDNI